MKIHSELTKYFNRNNKPQSDPLLKKTDQIQDGPHNSTCTYMLTIWVKMLKYFRGTNIA
jgi:hypothetical protein